MAVRRWLAAVSIGIIVTIAIIGTTVNTGSAQGFPPVPYIYSGDISIAGTPVEDGLQIVGQIMDYTSEPVTTSNGKYFQLKLVPPNSNYFRKSITFWLGDVVADQKDEVYQQAGIPRIMTLDLDFPRVPSPTPTPTPVPQGSPGYVVGSDVEPLLPNIGDPTVSGLVPTMAMTGGILALLGLYVLRVAGRRRHDS